MLPSLQSIFSTPSSALGRVEKATSRLLLSPDWMMNMDICNSINSDPWKAKAFVKAVRMRLQNKNSKVQFLALTLLEAMIKNCNDFVHFQVVERGILPEMVNIARKSKSMEVRDKILVLLESWQETFHGPDGRYPQFYNTYAELKRTGIHFPENPKNTDLILTLTGPIANQPQKSFKISTNNIGRIHQVRSETSHFSLSDLYNIQNVMYLFNNMLEAVNPNDQKVIKDEVITELVKQCEINQKKLVQLINSTEDDRLLVEALKLNDSLQTLLSKHDSLVSRSSSPPETAPPLPLLSLPHSPSASHQFNAEKEEEEEEDGFSALARRNPVTGAMIDLLSLTVSPSPSPPTPPLPPPPSNQNQNPFSDSLGWEYYLNQNQNPPAYNNYVAPWARPAVAQSPDIAQFFPQQAQQYESNHLPPSWTAIEGNPNPFLSTAYSQFSESQMFSSVSSNEVRVNVGAFQSSQITHF